MFLDSRECPKGARSTGTPSSTPRIFSRQRVLRVILASTIIAKRTFPIGERPGNDHDCARTMTTVSVRRKTVLRRPGGDKVVPFTILNLY
jgi:hypothetical protein